jgi:Cation transport ATPase
VFYSRAVNEQTVEVIREGIVASIQCQYIEVGDIVRIRENQYVPCDMVVLSTDLDQSQCYFMTANMDGETSLKTRYAAELTKQLRDIQQISEFRGFVECENPNPKLDNFLGRLAKFDGISSSFNAKTVALVRRRVLFPTKTCCGRAQS